MIAYCGIDCSKCEAYLGTIEVDHSKLKEVGDDFISGKFKPEDWVCLGCKPENQQIIAKYCKKCTVRTCAIEKGLQNCAVCDSYEGCEKLSEIIKESNPDLENNNLLKRMNLLRKGYLNSK
ncbi:DUF3795 domain-containing protein [Clostridiaceae bacterium M8S5]|nr:DUF3795 domain-containing protein [Clostridiaceae bacterium M8S5]